jgi:hypothetical protein
MAVSEAKSPKFRIFQNCFGSFTEGSAQAIPPEESFRKRGESLGQQKWWLVTRVPA